MAEYIRKFFLDLRQKASRVKDSKRPYDFRAFIPLSDVLKYCNKNYRITEKKVGELCKLGLLAVYRDEHGEERFSLSTPGRIEFIEDLRKNYQYPDEVLKEIIRHEQDFIMNILSNKEFFSYKYDSLIDARREMQSFVAKNPRNKEAGLIKKILYNLDNKEWIQLGDKDKWAINQSIFATRYSQEVQINVDVQKFREPILLGYSPQIVFKRNNNFKDVYVDWPETKKKIKEQKLRFVSINSFQLAIVGNQIGIQIKNPRIIKTDTGFEKIRSIYSIYRKILEVKNWHWGETEGYKKHLNSRRFIIRKYRSLCKEHPDYTKIKIISDFLKDDCFQVRGKSFSEDRINRITTPKQIDFFIKKHGLS